ncbi:retinol-binding protein pinta isoform X2 [Solenopsis invicta]|uniref:retinol-binding protein pinta isoform X2 n=1 Tax=Solenopsis invicta TaxID=13686 RepID=UPI000596175C|nr:retinol-binding protein pinta isoform X2 [Solenopsis invicta]
MPSQKLDVGFKKAMTCPHKSEIFNLHADDFLILRFLRVCKFNLEKTKVRMQNYYKHRSVLPEWYSNKNPFQPELQELLELGIILPLRKPDNQGRLIFIVRGTLQDPRRHKISDLAKLSILMLEAAVKYYPAATVHGYTLFIDIGNLTIRHILQFSTYILRNAAHTFQNCYPIRYQKVVFLNASSLFEILMRFIRPFMTEKLKSRFYVYSHEHCFEDISVNILPIEYGGTNDTLQELAEYWKEFIEENQDCLTKDETYPDSNTFSNNS